MADRLYKIDGKNPLTGEAVTEYPSVTTITGLMNKPFLIQAAVDVAVDYIRDNHLQIDVSELSDYMFFGDARHEYRRKWDAAALFGTKVHAIAERYFRQKMAYPDQLQMYYEDDPQVMYTSERHRKVDSKTIYTDHTLIWDDLFRKLYKGLHDWCKKNKVIPISMEEVLYGEGYAGRYDLVCTMGEDQIVTMPDIKTGKGSYYPAWKPQLAAYRRAYNETRPYPTGNDNPKRLSKVQAHGFLKWNKATEKWNWKDFSKDYDIDYKIFLAYRNAWWYTKMKKDLKGK